MARAADAAVVASVLVDRLALNLDPQATPKPAWSTPCIADIRVLAAGVRGSAPVRTLRRAARGHYHVSLMNWLTNYVLPKIRAFARKDVPDNLWKKCPGCEQMLFHRELAANLEVCRNCGHHFRIGSEARFKMLFDDGVFEQDRAARRSRPIRCASATASATAERLREGQAALGAGSDAVALAEGRIGGIAAVVAAFDFGFMGGSMGVAVGEGLLAAARRAVEREAALIVVPASGGARMQEGILSLMQMPRTILAADLVKEAGLPYIVLLTDPTTGGVSASFAMLGDITLAEPGAVVGFAGARVIEETIREKLAGAVPARRIPLRARHGRQVVPRAELARDPRAHPVAVARPVSRDAVAGGAGVRPPRIERVPEPATAAASKRIDTSRTCSLDRIERLLAALGNPHERLPPVIHVAGTKGKGSTVATMRACLEAAGIACTPIPRRIWCGFTSASGWPGALIEEDALLAVLEECERANRAQPITFFEITTAAAFLAFARAPADIVLLEVGLGGRLDTTNVVRHPAVTAITPVSLDHQAFLGDTVAQIAGEKAGILKPDVVGGDRAAAGRGGDGSSRRAPPRSGRRSIAPARNGAATPPLAACATRARAGGSICRCRPCSERTRSSTPARRSPASSSSTGFALSATALADGLRHIDWPARLQHLRRGPLVESFRAAGNCGSTAVTTRRPARCSARSRRAGAIARSILSSAC